MRIVTLAFASPAEFLSAYSEVDRRSLLFARTRTEASPGEALLLELSFPGLPNRALLRATARELRPGEGMLLEIDPADGSTRDFVAGIARGSIQVSFVERSHGRYPAALPVEYRVDGATESQRSTLVDLSSGGAFIRAETSPPAGSAVALAIDLADGHTVEVAGRVTWTGASDAVPGFGVDFEIPASDDGRRLRILLREAEQTGNVPFAPPRP
jgi:Tfp pilus assembly protein PilZ